MHYFFEEAFIILRQHTKHANSKLGVQYPLKQNENISQEVPKWKKKHAFLVFSIFMFSRIRALKIHAIGYDILYYIISLYRGTNKELLGLFIKTMSL